VPTDVLADVSNPAGKILIEVKEGYVEALCQKRTDRALAGSAGTDQPNHCIEKNSLRTRDACEPPSGRERFGVTDGSAVSTIWPRWWAHLVVRTSRSYCMTGTYYTEGVGFYGTYSRGKYLYFL
jgi:hypothetical protein